MHFVTCPVCGVRFDLQQSSSAPFCSVRCRRIDLGRWLNEEYSVPHTPDDDEEAEQAELPRHSDDE